MKRILFFKMGALGDLFFCLPIVLEFQRLNPDCKVTWVVGSTYTHLLKALAPKIEFVAVDEKKFFGFRKVSRLLEVVRIACRVAGRYHGVLVGHRDMRYVVFLDCLTSGPIFAVVRRWNFWLLGVKQVVIEPLSTFEGEACYQLFSGCIQKLKLVGLPRFEKVWREGLHPLSKEADKRYGVIHVGGGKNLKTEFRLKTWPYWSELIARLVLVFPEFEWIVVGASGEGDGPYPGAKNVIGKTTLQELVELIAKSEVVIGGDSGPIHIADALGKKVIGLYGPTSPRSWGLKGLNSHMLSKEVSCSPCYKDDGYFPECPNDHICMTTLSTQEVLDAVRKVIA